MPKKDKNHEGQVVKYAYKNERGGKDVSKCNRKRKS